MKLIIDINKDYYEIIKHEVEHGHDFKPYTLIAHGIPLDDIKAEQYNQGFYDGYKKATEQANTVIEDIRTEIEELNTYYHAPDALNKVLNTCLLLDLCGLILA